MSNSYQAITVYLKNDVGEEYSDRICDSIRLLNGVLKVKKIEANVDTDLAEERAKWKLREKIWELLK